MRRWPIPNLTILMSAMIAACSATTAPRTDLLEARRFGFRLILENRTNEAVFYIASAGTGPMDWNYCADPRLEVAECPRVPPNEMVSIPYADIYQYERGDTHVVVQHWRLAPKASPATGFARTDIRSLRVRLR